jgi:DNA-binding CsgD family transcriptional regulator/riboflavin transporter FmnP
MSQLYQLSKREREVAALLLQGKSNKLIALSLGISDRTVEFHLKNIYTKYQVSSRIELILKLGNTTGKVEIEELGVSTVDSLGESAENRDRNNSRTDRVPSFKDTVSKIGKELEMKNLLSTKHALVGVITALLTGFVWVALLRRFGHASLDSIKPWILPLVVILTLIGLSVGLFGKHHGSTPGKVIFSTLFGTGLGSLMMLPITVVVVLPLGKLAESLGLVDRAAMSIDVASTLVYTAMIAIWLIVGIVIGILLLSVTITKSRQNISKAPAPEHRF